MDKTNNGQVMLLTVLIISGVILGATTIAGLLMLYQIRQSTQFGLSMQALFAADTGLEWKLFQNFAFPDDSTNIVVNHPEPEMNSESMSSFISEVVVIGGVTSSISSVGCAGAKLEELKNQGLCPRPVSRAFELEFR